MHTTGKDKSSGGQHEILATVMSCHRGIENKLFDQYDSGDIRNREKRLIQAVQEAIFVLEESRKAFRSKHLEKLWKKRTQSLIDIQWK